MQQRTGQLMWDGFSLGEEIRDKPETFLITSYSLSTSVITHEIKHQITILFMSIIVNTKFITVEFLEKVKKKL